MTLIMNRLRAWIKIILMIGALTPLVVISFGPLSPVFGKMIFVRSLMGVVAIGSTLYAVIAIRHTPRIPLGDARNPLAIAVAAYMGSAILSTALSLNPYRSFFGDGVWGEGLYTLLACFVLFFATFFFFTHQDWKKYVRVVLGVGIIVIIVFLFQYSRYGRAFVFASGSAEQPGSFMGNPALLASFLTVLFGYVVVGYQESSRFWKYSAICVGISSMLALALLEVRGAMVGIAAAILFLVIVYVLSMVRVWRQEKRVPSGIVAMAVIVPMLFIILGVVVWGTRTHLFWQSVPVVRRLTGFSWQSASVQTRLLSWGVSFEAVKERPIFGWGLEQYRVAYNKHYDPAYAVYAEDWFDRAHNKILDVLVMQGIAGIVSYTAIFIAFFYVCSNIQERGGTGLGLSAAVIAYGVQNIFSFDHIDSYVLLFPLLSFCASRYNCANPRNERMFHIPEPARFFVSSAAVIFVIGSFYALYAWNGIPLAQAGSYRRAIISQHTGEELIVYADNFLRPYNFFQKEVRTQFLESAMATRGEHDVALKPLIMKAIGELEEIVRREPDDPRLLLRIAEAYNQMGQGGLKLSHKSIGYIEQARMLSPRRQAILGLKVFTLGSLGDHHEAIQLAREALALEPKSAKSHYYLGMALTLSLRDAREAGAKDPKRIQAEAFGELALARALGAKDNFGLFSESDFRNMMVAYQEGNADEDFLATYRIAQGLFPRNIDYYGIRLGAALERKNTEDVVAIATRIKELDPRYTDDMDIIIDLAKKQKWNILNNL